MTVDRTALSFWFPQLLEAGIPVPETTCFAMPSEAQESVYRIFDGEDPGAPFSDFRDVVQLYADDMGYPCFLRTDHTSAKHGWSRSCFLPNADKIGAHIVEIVEYSECCGFPGLPIDWWCVREYLPVKPYGTCPRYADMPICKEFRFFVRDGEILCFHPYWPKDALDLGGADSFDYEAICSLSESDEYQIRNLAKRVSVNIDGFWSVDILETKRGWYVTDMAEGEKSFHWPGCSAP